MNLQQLQDHVIKPALSHIGMYSPAAAQLVMGTGLQESGFCYIVQVGGPAVGPYQIEPRTFMDLMDRIVMPRDALRIPVNQMIASWPDPLSQLATNWMFSSAMCRIFYRGIPTPLPGFGDLTRMAEYWKNHYNTFKGKGRVEDFLRNAEPARQVRF